MSQMELLFREYLGQKPEIEKCYAEGLINRRALARHLIRKGIAQQNQLEAVVAMLRRFPFSVSVDKQKNLFKKIRTTVKDNILILDYKKEKTLLEKIQTIITHINYDAGDTLKVVVGSSSIKLFLDQKNEHVLKSLEQFAVTQRANMSEISVLFPETVTDAKGIIAFLTNEFMLNDIVISEFLTASPELLIYVNEKHVLKAYEILKRLQK